VGTLPKGCLSSRRLGGACRPGGLVGTLAKSCLSSRRLGRRRCHGRVPLGISLTSRKVSSYKSCFNWSNWGIMNIVGTVAGSCNGGEGYV